jgi:replication factor A1
LSQVSLETQQIISCLNEVLAAVRSVNKDINDLKTSVFKTEETLGGTNQALQQLTDQISKTVTPPSGYTPRVKKNTDPVPINTLHDGSKSVYVQGTIAQKGNPRKAGAHDIVTCILMGDGDGSINLDLWDTQINSVNQGDKIRIENGYVTSYKGEIQLNIGKYGKLVKL